MSLGELEKNRDVEGLIKALKDEDEWVRLGASGALGRIKDTKAVEPLIEALNDEVPSNRTVVVWVLVR